MTEPPSSDPTQRLDDLAAQLVRHIAVTHVMWDVFGKVDASPAAMENLHTATDQLRNAHHSLGQAVAELTGQPRRTPAFAPAAVTLSLEAVRHEVPIDDFDPEELAGPIAEALDRVSPAALADDNMALLELVDLLAGDGKNIPAPSLGAINRILEASGRLVTAAVHLAKAYRYCRDDFPRVKRDRWLDDFSWSIAGQRRDRKTLYLEKTDQTMTTRVLESTATPQSHPPTGWRAWFTRMWHSISSSYRSAMTRMAGALRR